MFFPLLAYVISEVLPLWLMGSALASSRFLWSHLVLALSNVEETSGIFSHKPTLCLPYTLKSCHSNSIHRVIWMSAFLHYSIRSQLPLLLKRQQICGFFLHTGWLFLPQTVCCFLLPPKSLSTTLSSFFSRLHASVHVSNHPSLSMTWVSSSQICLQA